MFRSLVCSRTCALVMAATLLWGLGVLGATIEEKAKVARAYVGKSPTIKCGPKNVGDVVSPPVAMSKLKYGSVLVVTPGNYRGARLRISANKVLITGDGSGKFCDLAIEVTGRDCVIRDLWVRRLATASDIVVVDSVIYDLEAGELSRKKSSQYFFNTCLSTISTPFHDMKVVLKKCTIAGNGVGIDFGVNSRFTISNCVIAAIHAPFRFDEDCKGGKNKLTMDNCVIFSKSGILGSKGRSPEVRAMDLKRLGRIANVFCKKNVQLLCPVFIGGKHRGPSFFIQTRDSPAKGVGVDPQSNPVLSKYLERMKTEKLAGPKPPPKPQSPKSGPDRKPPPGKTPPKLPEDDSAIGGIPEEPD